MQKNPQSRIKKFAVIGDPIEHSLSPLIQQAAFDELNIKAQYIKIRVKEKDLEKFITKRATKLNGFNITIPHKEKIIPLLDWIAPRAQVIGAVNTVLQHNKKFFGFNTDGDGYILSLPIQVQKNLKDMQVLLIGAGGAARAISAAFLQKGVKKLCIANRKLNKAEKIQKDFAKISSKNKLMTCALESTTFNKQLQQANLIINTTSVGLHGTSFENFDWSLVKKTSFISDIVYNPLITPLLKEAKKRKLKIHTGEGMLVYQAALAFELWTGQFPNTQLMKQVMLKALTPSGRR